MTLFPNQRGYLPERMGDGGKPSSIFLNLPSYKKPNNYRVSPYIYGFKPEPSTTVIGGGLEGRIRLNDQFGITGGANMTNVLFPGGNQQQVSYNIGANLGLGNRQAPSLRKTPSFNNGGDISIPDLKENNWLSKYATGLLKAEAGLEVDPGKPYHPITNPDGFHDKKLIRLDPYFSFL